MRQTDLGLNLATKKTRKRAFLDEMDIVVPWAALVERIAPHAPSGKRGRPPFAIETMLRIHCLQQWFGLSDPAMEEALFDVPLNREFAKLDNWNLRLPDESTILRFRHLLEKHQLAEALLHGEETIAFGDAGYQGVDKRPEASPGVTWHVVMEHGQRRALKPFGRIDRIREGLERTKASIRARVVEHPFRVLKGQFGYGKVRYRGLEKNTAQIRTLFAPSNLWMARRHLMGMV